MRYTVRIELHEPPKGNYDVLHSEMEKRGFVRWLQFGRPLMLPTAEYSIDTNTGSNAVLESAKNTAAAVHEDFAVLVSPVAEEGRKQFGLRPRN